MNPKLLVNIAAKFTSTTLTPGIQGLTQSVKPCHQKNCGQSVQFATKPTTLQKVCDPLSLSSDHLAAYLDEVS